MPASPFQSALKKLDPLRRESVSRQLQIWRNEVSPSDSGQIANNIANETALTTSEFTQLLSDFADALTHHSDPLVAWDKACGSHQFSGKALNPTDRPSKLGRASKFDKFLQYAKTTDAKFKKTLTKYAGIGKPPSFLKNILDAQALGGSVIFATFNDADSSGDPFDGLPWDRDAVRTALGLGQPEHNSPDPYLLFRYHSTEPPALPLHRPTIADAGTFSHFRPGKSAKAKWGYTHPVPPNSRKLSAMPELVHKQITGIRVVFPYTVTAT
jgi:hypothetical protein